MFIFIYYLFRLWLVLRRGTWWDFAELMEEKSQSFIYMPFIHFYFFCGGDGAISLTLGYLTLHFHLLSTNSTNFLESN